MASDVDSLVDWGDFDEELRKKLKKVRTFDPNLLIEKINKKIIDQDVLVDTAVHAMSERLAQKKRKGPLFSVLLAGPTGTGKTEFAKAIASEYFDDPKAMYRVDCGSLTGGIITSLVGSPQGFQGGEGLLTKEVHNRPNMVVLIDEIEKAAPNKEAPILTMMLSLLDEGYLTDERTGQKVDFTKTVVVITSNAEHQEMAKLAAAFPAAEQAVDLQAAVKTALENKPFAPEWLARVQLVTTTKQLTPKGQAKICVLELKRLASQYDLTIDEKGVDVAILLQAVDIFKKFEGKGARDALRWVADKASKSFIDASNKGGRIIRLGWDPEGGRDGTGIITAQIVEYDPDFDS